ncbi:polysaccharide deacetylase family protein [Cytobacillus depressus]|uniref:Polysaccharide deacetylase family protein n=1 Tax=Cytobacillus depressus TaxID=1602942 RepID=A0A6L3V6G0_9BACI|nr:polysaccharide deacetylase family protein [Cytobacillus depressus]KAB2336728.1 polysaccharide deacetylase family protein [Cytobacillus depressus]
MKKYVVSNIVFTTLFLIIIFPLCYLLYDYIIHYGVAPAVAKEPLNVSETIYNSEIRDFTGLEEYASQVPVLMYHQVIPEGNLKKQHYQENGDLEETIVTLENFTLQMDYLKEQNYTVLSLKEFELFLLEGKKVPAKSVLITFDDGFKNVFEFAYPVLKGHGFYAVHFLITGLITQEMVSYKPALHQYASIKEIRKSSDVFDYGNHTNLFHQKDVQDVSFVVAFDRGEVKNDIIQANEWLGQSTAFAAPYGEYNEDTIIMLRELYTKMAFTVQPGYAEPSGSPLEIPRWQVSPKFTLSEFMYILGK